MAARIHSRAMLNSFSRSSGLTGACLAKFTQSRANSSNRQLISKKAFSRVRRSSPRSAPATIFQENYANYQQFRASIMDWNDIAERALLNGRGLG